MRKLKVLLGIVLTAALSLAKPTDNEGTGKGELETAAIDKGCPIGCPKIRNPVCGSDGQLYDNLCLLKELACLNDDPDLREMAMDFCSPPTAPATEQPRTGDAVDDSGSSISDWAIVGGCNKIKCPRIRAPVCASDGQSYNNECLVKVQACLNRKKLLVKQYGLDQNDESGSQETGEELRVVSRGTCSNPLPARPNNEPPATTIEDPVRDAVILVQKRQIYFYEQAAKQDCPTICPANYSPVCGSDGRTYSNRCQLDIANCQDKQTNINILKDGQCGEIISLGNCPTICPGVYAPVCGSDDRTYSNNCELDIANCKDKQRDIKVLKQGECETVNFQKRQALLTPLAHPGPFVYVLQHPIVYLSGLRPMGLSSRQSCPEWCNIFRPVCGNDGNVYNSECHIRMEQCNGNTNLRVADDRDGCMEEEEDEFDDNDLNEGGFAVEAITADEERECPVFCTHEFDPVCGDNGVTFSNMCNLQIAQCLHDIDIEVIKHGVCDDPGHQDETDEENSSTLAATRPAAAVESLAQRPTQDDVGSLGGNQSDKVALLCDVTNQPGPVCGTDNVTYGNECNLRVTAALLKIDIDVQYQGRCRPAKTKNLKISSSAVQFS